MFALAAMSLASGAMAAGETAPAAARTYDLREINDVPRADAQSVIAIVGATLIDGRGGAPLADATVVVRGNKIEAVGLRDKIAVPAGARVIEGAGHTLMPGLIDAHFHGPHADFKGPLQVLRRGTTSLRDPGKWLEGYKAVRESTEPVPRLMLTGPFLDTFPSAHPHNAFIARDADEVTAAVNRFVDHGASAIKVYYRLPLALIRATTAAAHARGVPVTAHLELVDADLAIKAGLDGIRPRGLPHTETYLTGFGNMKAFVARAARAGVK